MSLSSVIILHDVRHTSAMRGTDDIFSQRFEVAIETIICEHDDPSVRRSRSQLEVWRDDIKLLDFSTLG
jgi:hypothetical protein